MKIHWKAPLQTKGFLKIIELVVAILCFALVASFDIRGTTTCANSVTNVTNLLHSFYPFFSFDLTNHSSINGTQTVLGQAFTDFSAGQAAQLFVAWGVLTMFYCIGAIAVYMLVTANEEWEKIMDFLVYCDLVLNIAWVLCWFIASVDWAVGYNRLITDVTAVLHSQPSCSQSVVTQSSYAQPGISVDPDDVGVLEYRCSGLPMTSLFVFWIRDNFADSVFGFLSMFLWSANIYWVLMDTPFFMKWQAKRRADQGYLQTS